MINDAYYLETNPEEWTWVEEEFYSMTKEAWEARELRKKERIAHEKREKCKNILLISLMATSGIGYLVASIIRIILYLQLS